MQKLEEEEEEEANRKEAEEKATEKLRKSQENEEAPDERSRLLRELDALKMQKVEHEEGFLRRKREEEELTTASVQEEMDKVRAEVGKEVDAKRRHEELDRLRQESDAFKGRPQDETELLRKLGWLPAAGQDAGSNAAAKDQKPEAPKQKGTRLQGDSAAEPTEAKKQNEEPLAPTSSKKQDEADEQEEDETQKTGQPGWEPSPGGNGAEQAAQERKPHGADA